MKTVSAIALLTLFILLGFSGNTYGADRYWVGGSADWDGTAGTKWATTSGGTGGASVPTSSDDVYFDANSGSGTVTNSYTGGAFCRSLNFSGFKGEYAGIQSTYIYGSLIMGSGMKNSYTGWWRFEANNSQIVKTNGIKLKSSIEFEGLGGSWVLQDDLTSSSGIELIKGTLNTNSKIVNVTAFQDANSSSTRKLILGASVITYSHPFGGAAWNFANSSGMTLDAGTSTIINIGSTDNNYFDGGGLTYHNVVFSGSKSIAIRGGNTFNALTLTGTLPRTFMFESGKTQIVDSFNANGTSGNLLFITSTDSTSPATLKKSSGVVNCDYLKLENSVAVGGAIWYAGSHSQDNGGNKGWIFKNPRYWVGGAASWDGTAGSKWATTSGGSGGASIPDSTTDVYFDGNSGAGDVTNNYASGVHCKNLNFSGFKGAYKGNAYTYVHGSLTLGSGMSISYNGAFRLVAHDSEKITTNGVHFGAVMYDGVGGTFSIMDTYHGGINILAGTLSTNNNDLYLNSGIGDANSSKKRSILLGSSKIFYIGYSGTVWDIGNNPGMTFDAGTSTIIDSAYYDHSFNGGGFTYNNVIFEGAKNITISGSNTFNTLDISGSAPRTITFSSGSTQKVNQLSAKGGVGNLLTINASVPGSPATLFKSSGTISCDFLLLKDNIAAGGATWLAGQNSIDSGDNSGWVFNTIKYPYSPFLDVNNNGSKDWKYSGSYKTSQITNNFSDTINQYLSKSKKYNSPAQVPLKLHSDSAGSLKLKNLDVEYLFVDTIKPTFISAILEPKSLSSDSSFAIRVKVTDNDKIKGVTALYKGGKHDFVTAGPDSFTISIKADTIGNVPVTVTVSDVNGLTRDSIFNIAVNASKPDLVLSNNLKIQPATVFIDDSFYLKAYITNNYSSSISGVKIALLINSKLIQAKTVNIGSMATTPVLFAWRAKWKQDTITVVVDPDGAISETTKKNNLISKVIKIQDPYPPAIIQTVVNPSPTYLKDKLLFKVKAIDSTGIDSVCTAWLDSKTRLKFNSSSGYYEGSFSADSAGVRSAVVTVYDLNGLNSKANISVLVMDNLPDLKILSSDFQFSPLSGSANDTASLQVKIRNAGNIDVANASVTLTVDSLRASKTSVSIIRDSSANVTFKWKISCGSHIFKVTVDSSGKISESDKTNNVAMVAYQFCANIPVFQTTAKTSPGTIPLGNKMTIQATISPSDTKAIVRARWQNKDIDLQFNSSKKVYEATLTCDSVGIFIIPVSFSDSNYLHSQTYIQFSVVDTLPDLTMTNFSVGYPVISDTLTLFNVVLTNNSITPVVKADLYLLEGNTIVDSLRIDSIGAFDTLSRNLSWNSIFGVHKLTAFIDYRKNIVEKTKDNNSKTIQLSIQDRQPPVINSIKANLPIYQGGKFLIEVSVTDNDTVTSVTTNFQNDDYLLTLDSLTSTWKTRLSPSANGNFIVGITATNKSQLKAFASKSIFVNDTLPDLIVDSSTFTFNHIDTATNVVSVVVRNNGAGAVTKAKFHFRIGGKTLDSIALSFKAGQFDTLRFIFNSKLGYDTLKVIADPFDNIKESNESNNSAYRVIFIPDNSPPTAPVVSVDPSNWSTSSKFKVSWSKSYDNSGKVTYESSLNGSSWKNLGTALSQILIPEVQGISYIYIRAIDSSGNESQSSVKEIKFDTTAPNAPVIAEYKCGSHWTTQASPHLEWLNPGDVGSGIQYFEIGIDTFKPQNIGFKFSFDTTFLSSGLHRLKVRAVDYVGHEGAWSNVVNIYIDLDNPNIAKILSPTHPDQNKWYTNDSIVLYWNRPADTSSVTGYFYMLTHDSVFYATKTAYWLAKDSLTITTIPSVDTSKVRLPDGIWYVHITSQDTVGHLSLKSSAYRIKLDKSPPQISATHVDTVMGCKYAVNLHCIDYYSGVKAVFYRIDHKVWITDTAISISGEGIHVVEYYATDLAGNVAKTDSFKVFLKNNLRLNLGKDTSICSGNTIALNAGNSFVSYLWSTSETTKSISVSKSGTYSVVVEDSSGCKATDTIKVIVNKLPDAFVGPNKSICNGQSVASLGGKALTGNTYLWTPSMGLNDSMTSNPIASPTATTKYSLTEVIKSTGCKASNSVVVSVNPLPLAETGPNTSVCKGQTSVVIGTRAVSGNSYIWYPATGLSDSGFSSPTASPAITTKYLLQETVNSTGCYAKNSVVVTVNPLPLASVGKNKAVCYGSSILIGDSAISGNKYLWSPGYHLSDSATASPVSNPDTTVLYTLIETVSATGCYAKNTLLVKVNPLPQAITGANKSICKGQTSASIGTTAITGHFYVWTPSYGLNDSTLANPTANPISSSTYSLLEVIKATGCSSSNNVVVTVNSLPTSQITGGSDTISCFGNSVFLSTTLKSRNTGYKYIWFKNDSVISGAAYASFLTTESGQYKAKTTDQNGCWNTSNTVQIKINPLPKAFTVAKSSTSLCMGDSFHLRASTEVGYSFQWLKDGIPIPGANNSQFAGYLSGSYQVKVTSALGCFDTSNSIPITTIPLPEAPVVFSGPGTICEGEKVILRTNKVSENLYSWYRNGVLIPNADSATLGAFKTGSYFVKVLNKVTGCTNGSPIASIKVYPLPISTIRANGGYSFCKGKYLVLNGVKNPGYTYEWSKDRQYLPSLNVDSIVIRDTGVYQLITIDSVGCTATSNPVKATYFKMPEVTFDQPDNTYVCSDPKLVLHSSALGNIINRNWLLNGISIPGASLDSLTIAKSGLYRLIIETIDGCKASSEITINVNESPLAKFSISNHSICLGSGLTFKNESSIKAGQLNYIWSFGNGDSSYLENPFYLYTKSGSYVIGLSATTNNGCSSSMIDSVVVHDINSSQFEAKHTGLRQIVFMPVDTDGVKYIWSFGDGDTSNEKSPQHIYAIDSSYTVSLTVSNSNGCSTSTIAKVKVNSGIGPILEEKLTFRVFPNPFETETHLEYSLIKRAIVEIRIFDDFGRVVDYHEATTEIAGIHSYTLKGKKPGAYTIHVIVDGHPYSFKVVQL